MENSNSTYLITFKDGTTMSLNWTSKLITPRELESYLTKISDKYDILNFNKVN